MKAIDQPVIIHLSSDAIAVIEGIVSGRESPSRFVADRLADELTRLGWRQPDGSWSIMAQELIRQAGRHPSFDRNAAPRDDKQEMSRIIERLLDYLCSINQIQVHGAGVEKALYQYLDLKKKGKL